jgi:hypothetical protein
MLFALHHDTLVSRYLCVGAAATDGFPRFEADLFLRLFLQKEEQGQTEKMPLL